MFNQLNTDIIQCIIMAIDTVDDLKNLYLTNKTFNTSLNSYYIVTLLTFKFNVVYIFPIVSDTYKTLSFQHFINYYGRLFVPSCVQHQNQSLSSIYYTHFNGERPYKVVINHDEIDVYKEEEDKLSDNEESMSIDDDYQTIVEHYEFSTVFIGKSPHNDMSDTSYHYEDYVENEYKYEGNSILIHIKDLEYIFIGSVIYHFQALAKITQFVSSMGRADVPYPYAVDEYNHFYLLVEHVIIKTDVSLFETLFYYNEPYCFYYNLDDNEDDKSIIEKFIIPMTIHRLCY